MPASSIPGVALIVAMFAAFMITLGVVSLRQALADRRAAQQARVAAAAPVQAAFPKTDSEPVSRAA